MKKNNIYIVVLVEYDHYRYQTNLYASINKKECIKWAKKYRHWDYQNDDIKLPIILDEKESNDNNSATSHLWIQKL